MKPYFLDLDLTSINQFAKFTVPSSHLALSLILSSEQLYIDLSQWDRKTNQILLIPSLKDKRSLSPEDLLGFVKRIEKSQKRVETVLWGPRTIDIDILYFGKLNFTSSSLKIPHPEILERSFVTIPLLDLLTSEITPTGDRIDRNRYDASTLVRIDTQEENSGSNNPQYTQKAPGRKYEVQHGDRLR